MSTKTKPAVKTTAIRGSKKDGDRRFVWVVEIEVHETWVADGFDLTEERAHEMIQSEISYCYGHEVGAKILAAPDAKKIRKEQGYRD